MTTRSSDRDRCGLRFTRSLVSRVVSRLTGALFFLVAIAVSGCQRTASEGQINAWLENAAERQAAGDHRTAELLAEKALASDDLETADLARAVAARSALALGKPDVALEYLAAVSSHDSLPMRAAWSLKISTERSLGRFGDAISSARELLNQTPDNIQAHDTLARLLATCGLRDEAVPHALRVLETQDSDLIVLLAYESNLIREDEALQTALTAAPADPYPAYGLARYAMNDGRLEEAIELLQEAISRDSNFAAASATLGLVYGINGETEALRRWNASAPEAVDQFADGWLARARYADQQALPGVAIRCYLEAAARRPESLAAMTRLPTLLNEVGEPIAAAECSTRLLDLRNLRDVQADVLFSGQQADFDDLLRLTDAYVRAGRFREAAAWVRVAQSIDSGSPQVRTLQSKINAALSNAPQSLVVASHQVAARIDRNEFPLPTFLSGESAEATATTAIVRNGFRLRDDAGDAGLDFSYENGGEAESALHMFEFGGGGVAAFDFDGDHRPDVFFTQGGPDPLGENSPSTDSTKDVSAGLRLPGRENGDRLFRNRFVTNFKDVTAQALISEAGFGQGAAVGDLNADGFADVYVANIGENVLWMNNGDGTFERQQIPTEHAWTASVVIADIDNDGFPDLYDANYLADRDVLTRLCRAADQRPRMCLPTDFAAARDAVLLNNADGLFSNATDELLRQIPPGKGLGLIAWPSVTGEGLQLFVANDTTPNMLLIWDRDSNELIDGALERGLALNENGKPEGCMGIALDDVNNDGLADVHITNFLAESNTLFLSSSGGYFRDATAERGLQSSTWGRLGFGTQFLDGNSDGVCELFVANGHLQDLSRFDRPFKMKPQLFSREAERFVDRSEKAGDYFFEEYLGRSVAKVDWNQDLVDDLVVTHLDRPVALLTAVPDEPGNAVSVRVVGTTSERQGVGAIVTVETPSRRMVKVVAAGGGYFADNDRPLIFGLGRASEAMSVTVDWPSGRRSKLDRVPTGSRVTVIEPR